MPAPDDLAAIRRARLDNLVPVDQPMCLISQLPRSGGTLLMHLFDGAPGCHTIPHEWGSKVGARIDADTSPEEAWEKLNEKAMAGRFKKGLGVAQRKGSGKGTIHRVPLRVEPELHRQIFLERYPREGFSKRRALDAYMTAYFNAWIDNQNLDGDKKWVVCFEPRMVFHEKFRERFDAAYPEGRVLSVVREPKSWFASASGWSLEWAAVNPAMQYYLPSVEKLLDLKKEMGDRLAIVEFSDLVQRTEVTMRAICGWLGIEASPVMLEPTVNRHPAPSNTSFKMKGTAVSRDPLKRAKSLHEADRKQIDNLAGDIMDRVAAQALTPAGNESGKKAGRKAAASAG